MEISMDVDVALSEVPVNILPLLDDSDFKSIETAVAYDAAGMTLKWNFITSAGAFSQTAVTPTTGGAYDWAHQGGGMYSIEIPASGGASINNDTEGYGWFTGVATGVLPWRGPIICFRSAALNDAFCDAPTILPAPQEFTSTGTPTTTEIECSSSGLPTEANAFLNMFAVMTSGTYRNVARQITASSVSGGTMTLATDAFPGAPTVGDKFIIVGKLEA